VFGTRAVVISSSDSTA